MIRELYRSMPDFTFTVVDVIAEGDQVVLRWRMTGTNPGPETNPILGPMPPAGRTLTCEGVTIERFKDNQCVDHWYASDWAEAMIKVGGNITPNVAPETEKNKAIVRRYYDEIMNAGKWDVVDELLAPDFQGFRESPGDERNRDQIKEIVTYLSSSSSDCRWIVEDLLAEGDKVIARWVWEGIHTGDYLGVPGTGKHFRMAGTDIWQLRDGKLVGHWWAGDVYGFMQQVGAIPTPTPEPA